MYLNASTDKLEIILGGTVTTNQLQWNVSWQDITSAGMTLPQSAGAGLTNNTTAVDIVSAPAASNTRQVTHINVYNSDTVSATVTIQKDVSGTNYVLISYAVTSGDTLMWSREDGWRLMSAAGGAIVLTGDVTGTGTSSIATTIANDAVTTVKILNDNVTYAKIQNVSAASRLLGRGSAGGAGDVEEVTLGTNLSMSGTTLNATGGGIGTIGTIDSQTKAANGAVISGSSLVMQTADATFPGLVSTGTQTFAGAKTLSSAPTFSTMTAGSVLFAGTSGLLSQSNADFFWDNTNKRLGLGTPTPGQRLHLLSNNDLQYIVQTTGTNNAATALLTSGNGTTSGRFAYFIMTSFETSPQRWDVGLRGNKNLVFYDQTANSARLTVFVTSGNVGINQGTDAGFLLDVNGTTRLQNDVTISDTRNIILATGTGTKIGTATTQKLGFWNAAPIVQPTTAVAAATRVGGGGTTVTDTDTFDGYTIAQLVKALRNEGLLA